MDQPERRRPPNLRVTDPAEQRSCASCVHYQDRFCERWRWPVRPFHVCDTWAERTTDRPEDQAGEAVLAGVKNVTVRVDPGGGGA